MINKNKRKTLVKLIIFAFIGAGLLLFLSAQYATPVLMYHHIAPAENDSRLYVAPESFERQMRFLKENNYRILSLGEYVSFMKDNVKPPKKSVVITFDDGYADNYINGYPTLKNLAIPATIFIVTGWVGEDGMMSWDEIRELAKSNIICIGSHTLSHCELDKIDINLVRGEIARSKLALESRLNTEIDYFSYPCGFLNEAVRESVKEAGYKAACATKPTRELRLNDIYAITRIRISGSSDNLLNFRFKVSGYYNLLRNLKAKRK
ncbi:MAG: polysaccharide deacetylase family protein [Candidatus Omnitrophica bacterium]|nr:polysaccharide deacetylase family protein [Candidatus Omnitrophota bacterium]MBU1924414.1 polysaccharide deacetylase family protein [Candidatus Omnitrophota bacterium]